ncbi:uncharacterized protein LOC129981165 [Argiope bruennichi]|uniref:uncharacterized protein LOC129981165 n=1 Tax=Argiope bruennichi TaxID=94029 RepID=UPI0024959473|nr:uncharacterized protein LOC129981165 [Argiope bruennichi]
MRLRNRPKMPTECSDTNNSDDFEAPNFDVRKFITEVEQRPAIWDTTSKFYSDKQMKKNSWDELVGIFINKENPSEDERNEYCRILQRKWKSARDCFNRECQRLKMAQQGIITSRKSPYVFYKNLSFLHKVMSKSKSINLTKNAEPTSNDTSNSTDASTVSNTDTSLNTTDNSSVSNTDTLSPNYTTSTPSTSAEQMLIDDVYQLDDDDSSPEPSTERRPKRPKVENDLDDDSVLTRMLQPNIQLIEGKVQTTESAAKTLEDDSDRLFLLSLLEPLKQVPDRLRMSVRVKMMQVVDSAMKWGKDLALE